MLLLGLVVVRVVLGLGHLQIVDNDGRNTILETEEGQGVGTRR